MICPKCNIEMKNGCCVRCGMLESGSFVRHEDVPDKYEQDRNYNKDFDKMNRNEKWIIPFLLGPFYFAYHRHTLTGYILGILEVIFFDLGINTTVGISLGGIYFINLSIFVMLGYLLLRGICYASFSNMLCIYLDRIRMKNKRRKQKSILYILLLIGYFYLTLVLILKIR